MIYAFYDMILFNATSFISVAFLVIIPPSDGVNFFGILAPPMKSF